MNVMTEIDARSGARDLTRRLATAAAALRWEDVPAPARVVARQAALDTIGCALAGSGEPLSGILVAELAEAGGAPQAGVIGRSIRLPTTAAALANGAAAHALDFDDVNMGMPGILPSPSCRRCWRWRKGTARRARRC